jgi:predicted double-glycine peptidase
MKAIQHARPQEGAAAARPGTPAAALAVLAALAALTLSSSCGLLGRKPMPRPFTIPSDSRLVLGLPFIPDDTSLCGPASLAAVMTYMGYPVTLEEASEGVQRWEIRGSLGPDLVLWARSRGATARFFSATPEELVELVNRQIPAIVQVDQGMGPVVMGHFMVVAGYTYEGIVVNTGLVQQQILPWSRFLTQWYRAGNFAIVVEPAEAPETSPPSEDDDDLVIRPRAAGGAAAGAAL